MFGGCAPRKASMRTSQPAATASELGDIVDDVVNSYDLRSAFTSLFTVGRPDGDAEDNDEDDKDDQGNGDDGNEGGTDASGEGAEDGAGIKDPDKKRLHDEAARYRNERNQLKQERDALAKQVREAEDKDKSKLEKAERDLKEAQDQIKQAQAELTEAKRDLSFFKSGVSGQFRDPADALRFLDLDAIKVDDDGNIPVKDIKKAAEDLLKEKPYLARKSDDDDDSGNDDAGSESGQQASGRSTNGKKKSKDELNAEALAKKYPALQGRS
jgi:hypothetical protein